jgi:hypothetical protein
MFPVNGTLIDRAEADMPPWFMPDAIGAFIPNDQLLRKARYYPGSRRPKDWSPGKTGTYSKYVGDHVLWVRGCGKFWTVERVSLWDDSDQVLTHAVKCPMPIFTAQYQEAMRLAEFCNPEVPVDIASLRWKRT